MSHGENTLYLQAMRAYYGAKGNQELEKPCLRKSNFIIILEIRN